MTKYVYFFGAGKAEGNAKQKELLGGKGAGLAEMTNLGVPVPPGFTLTTEVCTAFMKDGQVPDAVRAEVKSSLQKVEEIVGMKFGDTTDPLLVSVRSGARASMPGMMDTILNLGLTDATVEALAKKTNNPRFAWDAYRRFVTMYSDVVLGIKREHFEEALDQARRDVAKDRGLDPRLVYGEELKRSVPDSDIDAPRLQKIVEQYKKLVESKCGKPFPQDPQAQLWGAIEAVFRSWMNPRAVTYRKIHDIPATWGTACNVQAMVFGNMGDTSATGVAFTRDPSTGETKLLGEWLPNAQGEDVVAGIRTPRKISRTATGRAAEESLEVAMPELYAQFLEIAQKLEDHFNDMQDLEFTIQEGKLYLLQTRSGKRSGKAAVRIAIEMVKAGRLSKDDGLLRVDPEALNQLLHPVLDPEVVRRSTPIARGLNASPGAAVGAIVFTADEAERRAGRGEAVILVRTETSPEDIHGMKAAKGILTARGGMTCIAPETRLLTDRGLISAERAFALFEDGAPLRILSFDGRSMRPVWRNVIAAGRKPSQVVEVAVSQTGRAEGNTLRLTADHKMYIIEQRRLAKKRLDEVLRDEELVTVIDEIPAFGETKTSPALAYLAGALLSEGYINVGNTKGYVTFIQKPTPEKAEFIAAVESAMLEAFGVPFTYMRERVSSGELRGRVIRGVAQDRICFRREPAARLGEIRDNLVQWVLSLDRTALLHFLAGYVDGDGTWSEESSAVRLQISLSQAKPHLVDGVALACLRLGIVPQLTSNRENYTLQIAERVDEITAFTHRVKPELRARAYESRCLSARALFSDIAAEVNYHGRVKEGVKRNIMFGAEKIRRDILPLCAGAAARDLEAILDAPLRSYRIGATGVRADVDVYNFEVEAVDEIDKCFIAFTSRLTPLLISNSHAAVVARGMGTPCVAGTSALSVDEHKKVVRVAVAGESGRAVEQLILREGEIISLDGGTGAVYRGSLPLKPAELSGDYQELMSWADARRKLKVRTNGDTPKDARTARNYGAEGIGLCRTEHMFFGDDRINCMREMILANNLADREKALTKLLPFQREDFQGIFREMKGLPVTIRLLDPPLHEFLPHTPEQIKHVAETSGISEAVIRRRSEELAESNPMLGHRGCRLAITYPEIYAMQTRAILEAALDVQGEGLDVRPEIMIPLTLSKRELELCKDIVDAEAKKVFAERGKEIKFLFGTMIELPRAALRAAELAEIAEFFSFGTNDLTQTTLGVSRDDADKTFLPVYVAQGIFTKSPFATLDQEGVGEMVRIAKERGRKTRPDIKLGICGEHGGDPVSVEFFHGIELDYVSCSPFRVPIARLAAAQATIRSERGGSKEDSGTK
ncbi:MAG: pyruvate, phosphate dikinase [Deltaproteobacteria bacterium]|nr:pyruvate, phosphate dikinase [Deltaproteobacteria bacterium]